MAIHYEPCSKLNHTRTTIFDFLLNFLDFFFDFLFLKTNTELMYLKAYKALSGAYVAYRVQINNTNQTEI